MINLEVKIKIDDLTRQVWHFTFFTVVVGRSDLKFTCYSLQKRLTRRRKWKRIEQWSIHSYEFNNLSRPSIPQSVIDDAKGQLIKIIQDLNIV